MYTLEACSSCEHESICKLQFDSAAEAIRVFLDVASERSFDDHVQVREVKAIQAGLHSQLADRGCGFTRKAVDGVLSLLQANNEANNDR